MGFIACISNCKYQQNGVCTLKEISSEGVPSDSGCIHYIPKDSSKYDGKILKNKGHTL